VATNVNSWWPLKAGGPKTIMLKTKCLDGKLAGFIPESRHLVRNQVNWARQWAFARSTDLDV
jgi:hypothetical protein